MPGPSLSLALVLSAMGALLRPGTPREEVSSTSASPREQATGSGALIFQQDWDWPLPSLWLPGSPLDGDQLAERVLAASARNVEAAGAFSSTRMAWDIAELIQTQLTVQRS